MSKKFKSIIYRSSEYAVNILFVGWPRRRSVDAGGDRTRCQTVIGKSVCSCGYVDHKEEKEHELASTE